MPEVWALPTKAHASTTCYHGNKGGARRDLAPALSTSPPLLPPSFFRSEQGWLMLLRTVGQQAEYKSSWHIVPNRTYTFSECDTHSPTLSSLLFCISRFHLHFPACHHPPIHSKKHSSSPEGEVVSRGGLHNTLHLDCRATAITAHSPSLSLSLCARLIYMCRAPQLHSCELQQRP